MGKNKNKDNENKGPKKSSGGFSHFIHNVEHGVSTAAHKVSDLAHKGESKVVETLKEAEQLAEKGLVKVGHGLQRVASGVADTINDLEDKTLPSPTAIITETGLIVVGVAVVGILVLKFL